MCKDPERRGMYVYRMLRRWERAKVGPEEAGDRAREVTRVTWGSFACQSWLGFNLRAIGNCGRQGAVWED